MSAFTTAVATKAAIVNVLSARAGLSGVQVYYGDPGKDARRQLIMVGAVVDGTQEPYSLHAGPRRRDEEYTLKVHIEVWDQATPQAAETRAVAIGSELEAALAATPNLSGAASPPPILWARPARVEMDTVQADEGPVAFMTYDIAVRARLV